MIYINIILLLREIFEPKTNHSSGLPFILYTIFISDFFSWKIDIALFIETGFAKIIKKCYNKSN